MTKASTKGGFFGKALAAACSFALAASLVPAAALTAMADPSDMVQVNVGTMTEDGKYKIFKSVDVNLTDIDASSKANAARVFWSAGSWGVVATNQFITVETLAKKAGVDQYWTSDASINYSTSSWSSAAFTTTMKSSDFTSYDAANSLNYYPDTQSGNQVYDNAAKVPAGIAANGRVEMIGRGETADDVAKELWKAILSGTSSDKELVKPTKFLGLSETDYKYAYNALISKVTNGIASEGGTALASVNILVDAPENATRIAGKNWDDTMADAVDATFPNDKGQIENFVLATADNFPDALAASGLAGALNCPIIMTSGSSLTEKAGKLLTKYAAPTSGDNAKPVTIYVVGGKAAISDAVVDGIKALTAFYGTQAPAAGQKGLTIERIAGKEAWDTSLEIYKKMKAINTKAGKNDLIIATSQGFQDSMSIAPYAYATGTPIVLTNDQNVLSDSAVKAFFGSGSNNKLDKNAKVNIVGGKAVVDGAVESQLVSLKSANVARTAGKTAYNTSNQISTLLYNNSDRFKTSDKTAWAAANQFPKNVKACFATGIKYEDALASSAYCGKNGYTLSLVEDGDETTVDNFLSSFSAANGGKIAEAIIFGGAGIVPESILMNIDATL